MEERSPAPPRLSLQITHAPLDLRPAGCGLSCPDTSQKRTFAQLVCSAKQTCDGDMDINQESRD